MIQEVRLVMRPGGYWWLEHIGEWGDKVRELTGTNLSPTPFPLILPFKEVKGALQALEGVVVRD